MNTPGLTRLRIIYAQKRKTSADIAVQIPVPGMYC